MKTIKVKRWREIPENFTGIAELPSGTKEWYKDGKRHREDGPAVEWESGYKEWYLQGIEIYEYIYHLYKTYLMLDISPHPLYPSIKIHKILLKDKVVEHILIPGMTEYERKQ